MGAFTRYRVTTPGQKTCVGCGKELSPVWDAQGPDCTKARARAVENHHRCACGRKRRERIIRTAIRSWVACVRCLGNSQANQLDLQVRKGGETHMTPKRVIEILRFEIRRIVGSDPAVRSDARAVSSTGQKS
jgi:hypothetical protein